MYVHYHSCPPAPLLPALLPAHLTLQGQAEGLQVSEEVYEALIQHFCSTRDLESADRVLQHMQVGVQDAAGSWAGGQNQLHGRAGRQAGGTTSMISWHAKLPTSPPRPSAPLLTFRMRAPSLASSTTRR